MQFARRPEDLTLSLALRSHRECRSMCWGRASAAMELGPEGQLSEKALQPGETVCGVLRRHAVAHSLLFTWPRQARLQAAGRRCHTASCSVEITAVATPISSSALQSASSLSAERVRAEVFWRSPLNLQSPARRRLKTRR